MVNPGSSVVISVLYLALGGMIGLFLLLFALSSLFEKRPRAALLSISFLLIFSILWTGTLVYLEPPDYILFIPFKLIVILIILYFIPMGKTTVLEIDKITERVDERDIAFAREEYRPGTEKYEIYYSKRPHLKKVDDRIRALPELLAPGGRYYDPVESPAIDNVFKEIEALTFKVDGTVNPGKTDLDPTVITREIKQRVLGDGAVDVGVTELNPMYVYSHVGRGLEKWGEPIANRHRFAIMFALEMDYNHVETAPHLPITGESARQYLSGARISVSLAEYIRSLGYPARAHIAGSNYQIMLPPVAHSAGLGELGRLGYLISPKLGPRVRLGAVTTDLPLVTDQPATFGVQDFCKRCLKCAVNCPSGAIPSGDKTNVRGVEKWQIDIERCIFYWRVIGTDCGLCMKVCPFSHPPTLVHNLVRMGIRRSEFARIVSVWGDDLFYGRKARYERFPVQI
ncbi:MAG: 4Fe-4S dicluster domain-containing protein [Candidatus Zixiibacteriota bacterium]